jgi:hypothetical protein
MNSLARIVAMSALCLTAGAHAQSIVPIDEEPQHRLKFQNQHVRLFDVLLPPSYISLWHFHAHDGVFVNIEASASREQVLGAEPTDRPPRIIGDTFFLNYAKKPKVHRVSNTGESAFRVVDTEILRGCGGYVPGKDGEGQTQILDNERVRVTRIMIAPGERLALHPPCGILLSVSGGRLNVITPGTEAQLTMQPAAFHWRDQAAPLEIVDAGSEVFHAVDIVVK